ncbi:unnamed protein product, partial [Cercopithifilaria johnstoni]
VNTSRLYKASVSRQRDRTPTLEVVAHEKVK